MAKITLEGNIVEVKRMLSLIKAFSKISNIKETVDNDEYKVVIEADIKQRLYDILEKVKKDNLSEKDIAELVHHLSKVQIIPSGKSKICTSDYTRRKEEERLKIKLFIENLKMIFKKLKQKLLILYKSKIKVFSGKNNEY